MLSSNIHSQQTLSSNELPLYMNTSPTSGTLLMNDLLLGRASSLSNSMMNMSLNTQPQHTNILPPPHLHLPPPYTLRISNLPPDISIREAHLIFALCASEIVGVTLSADSQYILASFKGQPAMQRVAQLLDSCSIFGPTFGPIKVELDEASLGLPGVNHNISPPTTNSSMNPAPGTAYDSYSGKRPSMGTQRSRFMFSDPFNGGNDPNAGLAVNTAIQSQAQQPPVSATPTSSQLSDLGSGKSLLLMEAQNDVREYEQLVRGDPWGPVAHPPSIQLPGGQNPPAQSAPQTPGFEWDRRRQNSAFFNGNGNSAGNALPSQMPTQQSVASQQAQTPTQQQQQQQHPIQLQQQQQQQQQQQPQLAQPVNSSSESQEPPQTQAQAISQAQASSQISAPQSGLPPNSVLPDLSLLARVPPPANPADQNPPCNTLYVGNLPPDATETELRSLFAPQKGFRRLSFRTKNATSTGASTSSSASTASTSSAAATPHSHGPMCFVEFEDVAHATRALAELYGRALPRPGGVGGKGGIRLSFSKNPLGVRGPGNQRRTSTNTNGYSYLYAK
ncbi:hypothetical protein BABINDRAFT_5710 [Babjeviella inositovora NRRL Y-12698]|uniref:RRM domain-containing protein n=1 Tax=Babjeviella inositovora NRRL Y-12698 TaxID=984486 RepID=A0A1E3QYT9_9ASCO|nr:uncharacterized protein BABINDRAFT_5710 [Babjeviella inositovora NRRL Y-12698]ODQ82798.1 hypothetical protein BABINDRAFT_5710 [Babjeviella inositovora NRRL Y-12698]